MHSENSGLSSDNQWWQKYLYDSQKSVLLLPQRNIVGMDLFSTQYGCDLFLVLFNTVPNVPGFEIDNLKLQRFHSTPYGVRTDP